MSRATGDDSRNSMDVSRKQAAMLCFKLRFNYFIYLFYVAMEIPLAFEECLFLIVKSSSGQKILIGNIYHSPNSLQENDNKLMN